MNTNTHAQSDTLLIFASKYVGRKTVEFLVRKEESIALVVIADDHDEHNKQLHEMLKKKGIATEFYTPQLQRKIAEDGTEHAWILNLWSPKILKHSLLKQARHRLNIHSGLVPDMRGNDTTTWVIRTGRPAGVSLLEMSADVDGAGIYLQEDVPYTIQTNGKKLHTMIEEKAVSMFCSNWDRIKTEKITPTKQVGKGTVYTRKQTNKDRIRKETDTMTIDEWVRWASGHDFHPGTTAQMKKGDKVYSVRVIVEEVKDRRS